MVDWAVVVAGPTALRTDDSSSSLVAESSLSAAALKADGDVEA